MGNNETVWKYLNEEMEIFTMEEVIEAKKKIVLDIGLLGCRLTPEEIQANTERYRREVLGE